MEQGRRVFQQAREAQRTGGVAAVVAVGLGAELRPAVLADAMEAVFFQQVAGEVAQFETRVEHISRGRDDQHGERMASELSQVAHVFEVIHRAVDGSAGSLLGDEKVVEAPVVGAVSGNRAAV